MSDYTTPAVSDESIKKLCSEISEFTNEVSVDFRSISDTLSETVLKHYTVNHEPQIELPFEGEYDYFCEKVNKSLPSSKKLDKFTHIFISGYLPNGKTIRYNALEKDDNGIIHSRYAGLYINGKQYYTDYTCRAEEGAREKLNVLIVGAPKMGSDKARLDVDYADIPLENFKMILYDDVDEPINPDIDSLLASKQIDTLKVIGDYKWTYSGLCTLRRLELTKDILVVNPMYCPCIQELIIPNAQAVPNINNNSTSKNSVVKLDVSNVKKIQNLNGISLGTDLTLNCTSVESGALNNADIDRLYVGRSCTTVSGCSAAKITAFYGNISLKTIGNAAFHNCKLLREVVLNNTFPIDLNAGQMFKECPSLKSIVFGEGGIEKMTYNTFEAVPALTDLIFNSPITIAQLWFGGCPALSEQSTLNIINAIDTASNVKVSLHSTVKTFMANNWYCKLSGDKYVSCTAEDEGAMLQTAALVAKGGTLA